MCDPKNKEDVPFSVLNHTTAYAIDYQRWKMFFNSDKAKQVADMTRDSFFVHYWNTMMRWSKKKILLNSEQPLYRIFESNCPLTEEVLLRNMIGDPF